MCRVQVAYRKLSEKQFYLIKHYSVSPGAEGIEQEADWIYWQDTQSIQSRLNFNIRILTHERVAENCSNPANGNLQTILATPPSPPPKRQRTL